jgi:hypothetical protein
MSKSATIYPTAKRRKFYRSPPRTARLLNFFHFYRCLSLSARLPHRAALASLSARRSPIGHASGTEMRSQIERMAAAGHIPAPTASPAAPCPNTATSFFLLSRLYAGSAHPLAACPAPRRWRRPTSSSIHVVHARATSSSSSFAYTPVPTPAWLVLHAVVAPGWPSACALHAGATPGCSSARRSCLFSTVTDAPPAPASLPRPDGGSPAPPPRQIR